MQISDLLAETACPKVKSVFGTDTIAEVAQTLVAHGVGALVVVDQDGAMIGIVSERDLIPLMAAIGQADLTRPVSEIMTRDVISCTPGDDVGFVLQLMTLKNIRHMPVQDAGRLQTVVSIRQMTKAYDVLKIAANTDPLTKLSNRRSFLQTLETEVGRARRSRGPLTVAMLDLDHFKSVNDTYGHDAGDAVLARVSTLLISEFRTIDNVGRLGGEEFAVLFPETDLTGAAIACDRLLASIRRDAIRPDGAEIWVTASIGLAQLTSEHDEGQDLLKRADKLLYQAKADGRDRLVCDPDGPPSGRRPRAVGL
ncbi:MAG: diguanylate cyclase [Pseudomonadota bacterium]